jgi:hypothetical protein
MLKVIFGVLALFIIVIIAVIVCAIGFVHWLFYSSRDPL